MESNNIRMDIYRLHPFTLCPESNSWASHRKLRIRAGDIKGKIRPTEEQD